MPPTLALGRISLLAAAAVLTTAISAGPLFAAGSNATSTESGTNKSELKDSKKTAKTHKYKAKKKNTDAATSGSSQMQGYRPEADRSGGY